VFETPVTSRRPVHDEADVTQILTPIFHALAEGQDGAGAPDSEKRGPLQVVAGRVTGGAHRARSTPGTSRSYSSRPGFHSRPSQPAADLTTGRATGLMDGAATGLTDLTTGLTGRTEGTGAHRAPEVHRDPRATTGVEHTYTGAGRATAAHGALDSKFSGFGAGSGAGSRAGSVADSRAGSADSGSHHAVSRTGGRHRTLRAVSH
jgi:hypothetical protein